MRDKRWGNEHQVKTKNKKAKVVPSYFHFFDFVFILRYFFLSLEQFWIPLEALEQCLNTYRVVQIL